MGSAQSTRKLTIFNEDEDENVIKISEAVAKRLSEGVTSGQQKEQPQSQQQPQKQQQPQPKSCTSISGTSGVTAGVAAGVTAGVSASTAVSAKSPLPVSTAAIALPETRSRQPAAPLVPETGYYPHFTITALEVKQEKEKELADQELYWKERLDNLERHHKNINNTFDEEYKKALTFFDDCRVVDVSGQTTPCNDNMGQVLKCYQENPKETLRCSELVQQFSDCVDERRANLTKCN